MIANVSGSVFTSTVVFAVLRTPVNSVNKVRNYICILQTFLLIMNEINSIIATLLRRKYPLRMVTLFRRKKLQNICWKKITIPIELT